MEGVFWSLQTIGGFTAYSSFVLSLLILLALSWDFIILLPLTLIKRVLSGARPTRPSTLGLPPALIVIPTLLRKREELTSLFSTVRSVANNGYPSPLLIVVSIDGHTEAPALFDELQQWAEQQRLPPNHRLFVTGNVRRRGKPLAIEAGVRFVEDLVRRRSVETFPPVYLSTDADADLGEGALHYLVARLLRRNPITGWPARAVAGKMYIRGNEFWRGWRRLMTIEGQLVIQIAREYLCANVGRYNIRWMPNTGLPGVLYCTWSSIFCAAPRYMGYMRSLTLVDWLKWWVGFAPPSFSSSTVAPIPELVAGDTDDTVSAYLAVIARYEGGAFTLNPPRTPLHAFYYLLRSLFVDRALRYEPNARVFTSSPITIKSLFKQRKRWNAARIEVTGRFSRGLWFNWSLGLPAAMTMWTIAKCTVIGGLLYIRLPLGLLHCGYATAFILGYTFQVVAYGLFTTIALLMEGEARHWRMLLALPLAPAHAFVFGYCTRLVGVVSDVFLFGNVTGFAPEETLIRGGSWRIALAYRVRRAIALALRAAVHGDVPFGAFWFGWGPTRNTPSGFTGWSSGRRPGALLPREVGFRHDSLP